MPQDLTASWPAKNVGCAGSFDPEMSALPAVPDHDHVPAVVPLQLKQIQAALFEYFHATIFYRDLRIGTASPGPEQMVSVLVFHNHYVEGF